MTRLPGGGGDHPGGLATDCDGICCGCGPCSCGGVRLAGWLTKGTRLQMGQQRKLNLFDRWKCEL